MGIKVYTYIANQSQFKLIVGEGHLNFSELSTNYEDCDYFNFNGSIESIFA